MLTNHHHKKTHKKDALDLFNFIRFTYGMNNMN